MERIIKLKTTFLEFECIATVCVSKNNSHCHFGKKLLFSMCHKDHFRDWEIDFVKLVFIAFLEAPTTRTGWVE